MSQHIDGRLAIVHAFLFSLFSVVALLAANIQEVPASQSISSVLIVTVEDFS